MADTSKKVLVVDDSKNYLFLLTQGLLQAGFMVATAGNGEEGLEAVEKEKPDLILLDIEMPKMDGVAMAKKLRETDAKTPIIFLTNMSDQKHVSEALETNADYIVKADTSTEGIVARVKSRLRIK